MVRWRSRWLLVLAAVGLIVAVALGLFRREPPPILPPAVAVPAATTPASAAPFLGSASCAGRSCHGSLEPLERTASWQIEHTLWATRDPHANAYRVLFDPPAQEMARRIGQPGGKAHEAPLCLACHTNPSAARLPADDLTADFIRRERSFGVGCESCHGSAKGWLDAHISEGWRAKSAAQKSREYGLHELGDPATLVKTCAGCHVGAPPEGDIPARDVNHDLIAAGHPRLMFEASSYFANLPRHWKPKPRDEVQLWAVGQVVSAEAALELLQHRTSSPDAPWPEFAEYDCAGCHHDLADSSWRRGRGIWKWSAWYMAMPRLLAKKDRMLSALDQVQQEMEKPIPVQDEVRSQMMLARVELMEIRDTLGSWKGEPGVAKARAYTLMAHPRLARDRTWDSIEQIYLALMALRETANDDRWKIMLEGLRRERPFPPNTRVDPGELIELMRIPSMRK